MNPAVETSRTDPDSEETYHEAGCGGDWEEIGIGMRGIG